MNREKLYKEIEELFKKHLSEEINRYDSGFLYLEDYDFGKKYSFREVDALPASDSGRYTYGGTIYELYIRGSRTGIFYLLEWSRSGSYFSSYDYHYDGYPCLVEKKQKIVYVWEEV